MERIFVLVRVRPLNKQDDAKGIPWKISGNSISLVNQPYKFEFDRVLGHEAKNLDVYEARTKAIVAAAVGGFNGTVFAYGQTSSGKTHTMRGSQEEPGVIPHAVQDIFKYIQQAEDREFLLRMSYMEIYNEEINDLLVPEHRKLQIHESIERGIFVAGLREEIVASSEQVLQLMEFGESHRHFGETNMNVHSSRSHTIFRMVIESRVRAEDTSANNCDAVRVSVLNLVDLAGSERVAKTGAKGERLKEGSHINKSLMTLGTVINKLSEGAETNRGHVPYRDSKLTRILQPALGGNAKTAIICNVTPSMIHVDETKGTLQFASRALRVTNCAQVNEVMTDAALLKRQKKEIEELRAKFQASHSEHLEEEILNLRNTLLQSELEKERIALELQEEKRAQAERERQYALKIENLSTMVLYSAVDEREKHTKKFNRRETWCPTLPSRQSVEKEFKISSRASGHEGIMTRREMALPPPFHELCEINDLEVSDTLAESRNSSQGSDETHLVSVFNSSNGKTFTDSIYYDNASSVEGSVAVERMTLNELREELQKVQLKYKELECEHEKQKNLKNSEIESLKKRLNLAEDAIDKDLNYNHNNVSPGRSIDGVEERFCRCVSEGIIQDKQLEEQEKYRSLEKALADVQEKLEATEAELLATSKSRDSVSSQLEAASQRLIETSIELQTFKQNCDELEKYRSLEKVLADVHEKLEATEAKLLATSKSRDSLSSQLEATSKSLTEISFELHTLKHNYAELSQKFDYSESVCKQLEISLGCTLQEKEEMTVKFSEAVLELEEEKAKLIAREREEKDRWESDLNVTKANLFSVNSELEEVKKVLEFEQEQRKSSSLGLASLIEKMECSKAEYQTTINALNADIQNIRSTCEFLTQERDKVSLELLACKKDLEKRTAEGNERHRTIKQLKSTLKARNAEKSTLLSRQNSLREELDKMNYELGCARKIEEDLEGKVKLLEEQVNQEKLHFIRETSKLQVRLSVTRAKLEGSRQRQQETWDEKKLMHRKFEEAARKLKEQYVASQLECFELKKKLYDHGIS